MQFYSLATIKTSGYKATFVVQHVIMKNKTYWFCCIQIPLAANSAMFTDSAELVKRIFYSILSNNDWKLVFFFNQWLSQVLISMPTTS